MRKIAFLYAGQGSQHMGMGKDLYNAYPEFRNVFDSTELSFDIRRVCFENPDNMLLNTRYTQPCMVAFACGVTNILKRFEIAPDYVCGLSLGEYSALYAAGVWGLQDTISIVEKRGIYMEEASRGIESGMTAIIGLDVKTIEDCCEDASDTGIVSICNLNCPNQVIIGGAKEAVDKAAASAKELGAKRCLPLAISGPFHTAFMKTAGDKLEKLFRTLTFMPPKVEVLYNYLGGPNSLNQEISELLVHQVQHIVRMQACIEYLIENEVDTFIEVGPGTALSGFVKKTLKSLGKNLDEYRIMGIETTAELEQVNSIFK